MFSFYIARRYLFSRKSHHTINIISTISVCGVALATMALVVTLSVFNGFRDMVASFFTAFDPELKVTLAEGKCVAADDPALQQLRAHDAVEAYTEVLEDQALIVGNERQWVITIKGVDDNFQQQADIDGILYGDGEFILHADVLDYGIMGIRLAQQLGLGTAYDGALPIYAPRRGERVNMGNPMQSFNRDELYSPGVVFAVNQSKYDASYIVTSIAFARRLFDRQGLVSAVELKLKPGTNLSRTKGELRQLLGDRFRVEDRYEQQADTFRIMQVEKLIAYLFLSFILLVACFNIIGSLSMLMIDKRADVETLRALGADDRQISQVFLLEGWLISGFGAAIGIAVGLLLCWLQMEFGLIKLGNSEGAFIIDAYPVSVHATDLLITFATVLVVGYLSVWLPVRRMTRQLLAATTPNHEN
ncbi:MAG: ABC transporter permease [Bacteroidaceae bacterium]|nr:ABC transporter permease [Bacteroidaceae bacterium]MBR1755250.1 ABC transporter permease [Bacteroidaceae bacterium]